MFVANRVAEVLELTTADEWYHVHSADNPADAGTRELEVCLPRRFCKVVS